jgi:D-beta-D-heptose 7-phosphate kinase/D-beta-D-heptose 1-phosphate adenosyltransferase
VRTGASLELARVLAGIGRPRIAVVGDAILDEYVWGEVERISPEAPIPVLRVARRELRAGGAGSVVSNLARLGADVRFFSVRGADAAGEKLAGLLGAEGAATAGMVVEEGRPTTSKTRHLGYVQHADRALQQILRTDDEVRRPIEEATIRRIAGLFREGARDLDAILVSDYHKGLVSAELIGLLRQAAPGVPILVDPALVDDYSPYRGSFLICPNRYEAGRATGIDCGDIAGCSRAAEKLARELDLGAVALTMDREGIFLHQKGGRSRHFPTRARTVSDVTGAGDMVLSILGIMVAAGASLEQAVELSNVAAGIEVRRIGVTPLCRDEIIREIHYEGHPGAEKIQKLEDLVAIARDARAAGKTVVLTNGCFDFLHLGHLHLLQGASMEGDILIVAVNSDASIRRLKGPERPAIPEDERLLAIAGLEAVDYVISFEEDTPIPIIEALQPHVLVKGEEYRSGIVVGREIVERQGGRVAFVSQIPGISTTALLGARRRPT